jgi:hypothetical protein
MKYILINNQLYNCNNSTHYYNLIYAYRYPEKTMYYFNKQRNYLFNRTYITNDLFTIIYKRIDYKLIKFTCKMEEI